MELKVIVPRKGATRDNSNKWLDEGLQQAIDAFERAAQQGSESGPFLVRPYVSYATFETWYKAKESIWRLAFQFTDAEGGKVLLYGDPSFLHESVSNWFGSVMIGQVSVLLGVDGTEFIQLLGSSRLIQGSGGLHKEPDFIVQAVGSTQRHPPFVGEVAYANESLLQLQDELVQATAAGCAKVAYGVKLTLKPNDRGGFQRLSLRFLERRQGDNDFARDIDFSPGAADHSQFKVELELKTLFAGMQVDKRLMEGKVTFDLFKLQQRLLVLLKNGDVDFVWSLRNRKAESPRTPLLGVKREKTVKERSRIARAVREQKTVLTKAVKKLMGGR